MNYKAILFDMDGTVLDTIEDLNAAMNATLAHFGFPPRTVEETRRFIGNGSRVLARLSVPEGTSEETVDEVLEWYGPYYNAHANDRTRPYDGILPMMDALKAQGYQLAIVSNKPDRTVKELAKIYFPTQLETAVGENEKGGIRRKPAPDTVLAAAAFIGVEPGECLYVGDSEVDVQTAKNAGMDCASVLWGFRSQEEIAAAGGKLFFESPEQLREFLK